MRPIKHHNLDCPECGGPMVICFSKRYPLKDGNPRPFYRCRNMDECRGSHGAHPDGTPLGVPGDAETRKARRELHELFKTRFKFKKSHAKRTGYWLQERGFKLHIGEMTKEEVREVFNTLSTEIRTSEDHSGIESVL